MKASVWFIPGWLRAEKPASGVLDCVSNAFGNAAVEFKQWDGDNIVWPLAVDSADKEAWRFAFEIATMSCGREDEMCAAFAKVKRQIGMQHAVFPPPAN